MIQLVTITRDGWRCLIYLRDHQIPRSCGRSTTTCLIPDTYNCGLCMRREYRERFPRHCGLVIPTCISPRVSGMPGSLTNGFIRSRWRGKRSRHSRCMRNPQFYVSGKRPMILVIIDGIMTSWHGDAFRIIGSYSREPLVHRWYLSQRTCDAELDDFSVVFLNELWNKLLDKQSSCWRFQTTCRSCDVIKLNEMMTVVWTIKRTVALMVCRYSISQKWN